MKKINIVPKFKSALDNFSKVGSIKTLFKEKTEKVIKILKNDGAKINLKNIQQKYEEIFDRKYSLMTFSRIMRNHLNLRFLKTSVKNPKLQKDLYRFMKCFF